MPYRSVLTAAQLEGLLAVPATAEECAQRYGFEARDLALIRQRRGDHNRLGFAIQLCYLRYPGQALAPETEPPPALLAWVARQVRVSPESWLSYAQRDETRREHALELQTAFDYRPFTVGEYRRRRHLLTALAVQTNKAPALAQQVIEGMRRDRVIVRRHG